MTTNDFFLVERAAQIQRLRAARSGNHIDIPGKFSRFGYARPASRLFHAIDEICRIPLGEKRTKWLRWLMNQGGRLLGRKRPEGQRDDEPELLTPQHRTLLNAFERDLVQLALDEDPDGSAAAAAIMDAILRDRPNFAGLKPLPFHSDNFPYEFLFPSWLNLYAALVHSPADAGQPHFSAEQIKAIFGCLQEFAPSDDTPHAQLVGALTLAANRLPAPQVQQLIQRMLDVMCLEDRAARVAYAARIGHVREQAQSAPELLSAIRNLTIFELCSCGGRTDTVYSLGPKLPTYEALPPSLASQVRTLEETPGKFALWAGAVGRIAHIADQGGGVDSEFAEILAGKTECLEDWLALLAAGDDQVPLTGDCQRLLARIVRREEARRGQLDFDSVRQFAREMAPRLNLLDTPAVAFFEQEFVEKDDHRAMLLGIISDSARRRSVSQQLLTHAAKTQDRTRLLGQLGVAVVLDPRYDASRLSRMGRTVRVLRMLQEQGYISSSQLDDLAGDVRGRLPDSIEFLVEPLRGAAEAEGRLGKLYLALYEECERFEQLGETGNFGITSAVYGKLNRDIESGR